jgi:hypothetical protein
MPFRSSLFADTTQKLQASFNAIHIDRELTEDMIVKIVSIDGIDTEKSMQQGYVNIAPMEKLPKAKVRNPVIVITRH